MPRRTVSLDTSEREHRLQLEGPGALVPDGDGGWTQGWGPLTPPEVWGSVRPASLADLERVVAGATTATQPSIVRCEYHPGVTVRTRVKFGTRTLNVVNVVNEAERNVALTLVCDEDVGGGPRA